MKTAVDWGAQEAIAREKSNLEETEKSGVEVQKLEDHSAFDSIAEEVRTQYANESEIINSFIETAKND